MKADSAQNWGLGRPASFSDLYVCMTFQIPRYRRLSLPSWGSICCLLYNPVFPMLRPTDRPWDSREFPPAPFRIRLGDGSHFWESGWQDSQAQRCCPTAREGVWLSITWTPQGVVKTCFMGRRDCILCSQPCHTAKHVPGGRSAEAVMTYRR